MHFERTQVKSTASWDLDTSRRYSLLLFYTNPSVLKSISGLEMIEIFEILGKWDSKGEKLHRL